MEKNNYDSQGRLIRFKTKQGKGVLVFRQHDTRNGTRIYRDYFTYQVKRDGKRYYFSLPSEKSEAAKLADQISAFLAVKANNITAAIAKFTPDKLEKAETIATHSPTVGELIKTYRSVANHATDRTRNECAGALRRIAGFILGFKPCRNSMGKKERETWRAKVDSLNVSKITPGEIEAFRGSLIRNAGSDEINKGKAIVTANAYIRNAGCIFVPKMRKLYTNFSLHEECPFKVVGQMEERPHRYISKVDIAALVVAAREELQEDRVKEFVVFVLSLFAGLRRGEIDRLIWDQIDFQNEHIWIRTTPFFRPKAKNSEDRVDCPSEVFDILRNFKPFGNTPPFVIPGASPEHKVRCRQTFQPLYQWLHGKGIKDVKALHTLRKEAGSNIFALTGSTDKAADFLRNDPRTAREYYLGRKDRIEVEIPGLAA